MIADSNLTYKLWQELIVIMNITTLRQGLPLRDSDPVDVMTTAHKSYAEIVL